MEPKEEKEIQEQILIQLKKANVFLEMLSTVCTGLMRHLAPEEYRMYLDDVYGKGKEAKQ